MNGLNSTHLEFDEIWGFIGKKKKNVREDDSADHGDVWTFIAIDADTKIIPAYKVGKRDLPTATAFMDDLSIRLKNRVQISADGLRAYEDSIKSAFDSDGVDFGQIVKTYSIIEPTTPASSRYSPGEVVDVTKYSVFGQPDMDRVSTSYVEKQNHTLRMHCRRLTRLTNAFSKKLDNFKAAVALNFAYYNFVKRHITIRMTPAMAAGIEREFLDCARFGGGDRMTDPDYIKGLQDAIRRLHGSASKHVDTVAVNESFKGKPVWAGEVEKYST